MDNAPRMIAHFPGNATIHAVVDGKIACGKTSRRYFPMIVEDNDCKHEVTCKRCND
jgi:hypothetical protein